MESRKPLQLLALNHISRVCTDLAASYRFYTEVLGFIPVKRPSSFDFEGAWLHNYGIGLHLIKGCLPSRPRTINPKSCHISFQAASLAEVEDSLVRQGIQYVKNLFVEDGVQVGQLFFHDPDGNMIEICNCDVLPVVPLEMDCSSVGSALPLPLHHDTAAATWHPAALPSEPSAPARVLSSAPTSSDAGSDDSLLHATTFEATSLLTELPPQPQPATTPRPAAGLGLGSGIACDDVVAAASSRGHESYGSFSSAMSDVMMSEPLGMPMSMSIIPGDDLADWRRRVAAAAGAAVSSTSTNSCASGSFIIEVVPQLLPPRV